MAATQYAELANELFARAPAEGAAFLAAQPDNGVLRIRSYHVFGAEDLEGDGFGHVQVTEEAQVRELASIKRRSHAAVEAHTHPGSGSRVRFSGYDEDELPRFARYVQNKMPGKPFAALVLAESGYAGRAWREDKVPEPLHFELVGEHAALPSWISTSSSVVEQQSLVYDRQVRALGTEGQARLAALRVGVVGLGGTGSLAVQVLVHLGIRRFVLVDDDRTEPSNLPRLAGAAWWDARIRRRKAAVARRVIRRVAPTAAVSATGTLRSLRSLESLEEVDLIIGCVDNDGARLLLTELAASFLIPYLDLGVGIEGAPGSSQSVGGRVSFYLPGAPCLACADELDFAEAAEDLESEGLRKVRVARGYARDRAVEPALMPLNTAVVGLGMMELLAFATGLRRVLPFSRYDAMGNEVIRVNVEENHDCPVCQHAYAMGQRHNIQRYAL